MIKKLIRKVNVEMSVKLISLRNKINHKNLMNDIELMAAYFDVHGLNYRKLSFVDFNEDVVAILDAQEESILANEIKLGKRVLYFEEWIDVIKSKLGDKYSQSELWNIVLAEDKYNGKIGLWQ